MQAFTFHNLPHLFLCSCVQIECFFFCPIILLSLQFIYLSHLFKMGVASIQIDGYQFIMVLFVFVCVVFFGGGGDLLPN